MTFNFTSKDGADADTTPDDAGKVVGLLLNSPRPQDQRHGRLRAPVVVPVLLDGAGKGSATVALSNVTEGATFTLPGVPGRHRRPPR